MINILKFTRVYKIAYRVRWTPLDILKGIAILIDVFQLYPHIPVCTACDTVAVVPFERTNHIACTSQPSTKHAGDNLTDDTPVCNYI